MMSFRALYHVARDVIALNDKHNLSLIAAGVAFFSMLSLFPALAALIAILGLFLDPALVLDQASALKSIIPAQAYDIIAGQIAALVSARTPTLSVAGLVSISIAIWFARAGVGALMMGLNMICEVEERSGLRHYLSSIALTIGLIGVAVVALGAVVVAPVVLALLPVAISESYAYGAARWGLAIVAVMAGLGAIYRFAPNRAADTPPLMTSGALVVAVAWFGLSYGFSFYLSEFANYNEIYGSIGAVAALMMWFYVSGYLVLIGAAWNVALERRQIDRPS